MKRDARLTLKAFLIELMVYGTLVVAYFFLVLHFLGAWLHELQLTRLKTYAVVSLALIIGQAAVLEIVTTWLLKKLRGGRSE